MNYHEPYLDQGISNERHDDTNKKPITCKAYYVHLIIYYLQQKGTLRFKTLQLKDEECK